MTSSISRRGLIGGAAAAGLGIVFAATSTRLPGCARPSATATLVPDPAGMLALPPGFSYRIVAETGVTTTEDGVADPSDPDANGVFRNGRRLDAREQPRDRRRRAVRRPAAGRPHLRPGRPRRHPTIEVDADGNRVREYTSVAGTHNNCAGGITPVGHLADLRGDRGRARAAPCRRTTATSSRSTRRSQAANLGKSPVPLKFLGRFAHEAVAVDPRTARDLRDRGRRAAPTACTSAGPRRRLQRRQGRPARARLGRRRRHRRAARRP